MSVVRSNRLGNGSATVNGEQIVGTVPAGKRWCIKHFNVYNNTNASHQITLGVQIAGVDYWISDTENVGSGGVKRLLDEVVLVAGDKLLFYTGVSMGVLWYASGIEFTL